MTFKVARLLASLAAAAAVTVVCSAVFKANAATVAMFYLLAVLLIAAFWGLLESIAAAIVAVLCFNYFFLPPVLTFTIADSQNWLALFAFVATAIIGSQLSSYARRQASKAWDSKRETEQLYSLSRTILLLDEHASAASQIARHIVRLFGFENAVLFDRSSATLHYGGSSEIDDSILDRLKEVATNSNVFQDEREHWRIAP